MTSVRLTGLVALLTAATFMGGATDTFASAQGKITAQRVGTGPFSLSFSAGGSPTKAHGHFTYQEPQGYTVSGKVTCYFQEDARAVFTGPVTKEANPDNDTQSLSSWSLTVTRRWPARTPSTWRAAACLDPTARPTSRSSGSTIRLCSRACTTSPAATSSSDRSRGGLERARGSHGVREEVLVLLVLCAMTGLHTQTSSAEVITNEWQEFVTFPVNTCNGEFVPVLSGVAHVVQRLQPDGSLSRRRTGIPWPPALWGTGTSSTGRSDLSERRGKRRSPAGNSS